MTVVGAKGNNAVVATDRSAKQATFINCISFTNCIST